MTHGGETVGERMRHPWLVSFGTAFVVAMLSAGLLPLDGESTSYTWGSHLGTLLIPAVGVGIFLRFRSWPWWAAVVTAVGVFAVVLGGVTMARAAADRVVARDAGDRTTGEPSEQAGPATVTAPESVGTWRKMGGREARRWEAQVQRRLADLPAGFARGRPEAAMYRDGAATVLLVTSLVGDALAEEFAADAEQGAADYVSGAAGVQSAELVDPGPLGGGAACVDDVPPALEGAIVCGWTDARTLGQVTVRMDGMTVEDVVPLVHLFREAVVSGER